MQKIIPFVAAALFAVAAQASDSESRVVEKPLVAQTLADFNVSAAQIHREMEPGGTYEFIKPEDRRRVDNGLAHIGKLLQDHASASDLSSRDKITLVNAQEEVNAVLKHNDSNRLVCESRAPIGSHIPVNTCRRYGDIEERRAESRREVTDNDRSRVNTNSGN